MTTLPSNLLLMDTSMPHGVVAFAHEGKLVAERILKESRRHGEQLSEALDTVLLKAGKEFSDLEGIIIGTGPGSFVGVRVAMATGKGIAVAQQVPLWGVSTLAALAHGVKQDAQGPILSLIDARRGQGYARRFDFSQSENAFGQAQAIDPQELPSLCEAVDLVVGNGLFLFDEVTSTKPPHRAYMGPTGHGLLEAFKERCPNGVPDDEQISLVPEYVRAPDAKMPAIPPNYSVSS